MKAMLKNLRCAKSAQSGIKIGHNFYKEIAVIHPAHDCVAKFRFYMGSSVVHCMGRQRQELRQRVRIGGRLRLLQRIRSDGNAINHTGIEMSRHWGEQGDSAMRGCAQSTGR